MTLKTRSHDPFLGDIIHDDEADEDFIFGRGAIDDKQVKPGHSGQFLGTSMKDQFELKLSSLVE
jgi:hypothetical protein